MGICVSFATHKKLYAASYETTPQHSLKGCKFDAVIVDCYDGDTCIAAFKAYEKIELFHCRLAGIDTPEMHGSTKDVAMHARDTLVNMISSRPLTVPRLSRKEIRKHLSINKKIVTILCDDHDKYGRVLVNIVDQYGCNINKALIDCGVAKPYDGGKKEEFG